MNITFRQMRLFMSVAEHRTITAAARACHVTQPTVSMQLKDMSSAIGLPLYEQIGKSINLTTAGEALIQTSRAILNEWNSFEQEIIGLKNKPPNLLKAGGLFKLFIN